MNNKTQFISALAETQSISKKQAAENLSAVLDTITDSLVNDGGVQFIGDFSLSTVAKPARDGRNPSTGKPMKIKASTAVKLKVGATLKSTLNK